MVSPNFTSRKIVVIGTGYVGLPAALLLARAGHSVVGVDIDDNIVQAINEGILHIKEDQLQAIMDEPEVKKNITAQSAPCPADIFLIAVPTPLDVQKKAADLSMVIEAIESLIPHLREGNLVILESTVPPLTCRTTITPLLQRSGLRIGETLHLAHCPERILPGDVFHEIVHNDRIIGAANSKSRSMAADVYSTFVQGDLLLTDDVTAEMVKLMENTYRDVNIALGNEFAAVAHTLQIDIGEAIRLANQHPRVNILNPGIGVGGHCIPIDPWFIKEVDPTNARLIFAARTINDEIPTKVAAHIRDAMVEIENPQIVAIGAAYKENTADTRESPSVEIVRLLRSYGFRVNHFDPFVEGMEFPTTIEDACKNADCLALLVKHKIVMDEFNAKRTEIENVMKTPKILQF